MSRLLFVFLLVTAVAPGAEPSGWSPDVPQLGVEAYHDFEGWHELVTNADTNGLPTRFEAVGICRSHEWKGYIRIRSADSARDTEPCVSVKPGNSASPIEPSDVVFAYSPVPGRVLPLSLLFADRILLTIAEDGSIRDAGGTILIDAEGNMRCRPAEFAAIVRKLGDAQASSKNP